MFAQLRSVVLMFVLLTLVTGVAYPLLVTVIAQVVFPYQANGSLIVRDGKLVGSELIGQSFDDPKYFWGRPSATGAFPDDASASSGSNLGPTNPAQLDAVRSRIDALKKAQPDSTSPVPIDLVTASASGLDPQISPAAAEYQVARVAKARGLAEEQVRKVLAHNTEDRTFGFLGEPRVNVLTLNLALDDLKAAQ
jgi:potassium-transporting ATPase KdpC subunit